MDLKKSKKAFPCSPELPATVPKMKEQKSRPKRGNM